MATRKQTMVKRERDGDARGTSRRSVVLAPAPARASRAAALGVPLPAALDASSLTSAVTQRPIHFTSAATYDAVAGSRAPGAAHDERFIRPATSVRQKFGELREALADGWEIVQPIFARPLWSVADDSITAFNFVLRRERTTRLVTVPGGRTVQRFIRDRQLIVDYRR
jgi:hypothetical protein